MASSDCVVCLLENTDPKWECQRCHAKTHLHCALQWMLRSTLGGANDAPCPACREPFHVSTLPGLQNVPIVVQDDDDDDDDDDDQDTDDEVNAHLPEQPRTSSLLAPPTTVVHINTVTINHLIVTSANLPTPSQILTTRHAQGTESTHTAEH